MPVYFTAPARELLVHVANGDSPPLAIDAVTAFQTDRMGRGAFKVVSVLVWLFIAYMLYETNKRIPTDDK